MTSFEFSRGRETHLDILRVEWSGILFFFGYRSVQLWACIRVFSRLFMTFSEVSFTFRTCGRINGLLAAELMVLHVR